MRLTSLFALPVTLLCYAARWPLIAHSGFAETQALRRRTRRYPEEGVSVCHWFRFHKGSEVDGKRVTMLASNADRPESTISKSCLADRYQEMLQFTDQGHHDHNKSSRRARAKQYLICVGIERECNYKE